jgi:uncharacterized protein (TIGR03435 family)
MVLVRNQSSAITLKMKFRIFVSAVLAVAHALSAQTPAYTPTLTFDVASIHQNEPQTNSSQPRGSFEPFNSSHLNGENWSLRVFLIWAYDIDDHKIVGLDRLPFEVQHATFHVQATADAAADAKLAALPSDQRELEQMHMLQTLLAERFNLKAHWEVRETRTYDLVISKPGKLRTTGAVPGANDIARFGDRGVPRLYEWGDSNRMKMIAHGATTSDIAEELSANLSTLVRDKTGLTGKFDFEIAFATYQIRASDQAIDETNPLSPLEVAIRNELGLKLVPSRGPVSFLVIDHAEMPTAN